jgi:hypothetical protein
MRTNMLCEDERLNLYHFAKQRKEKKQNQIAANRGINNVKYQRDQTSCRTTLSTAIRRS